MLSLDQPVSINSRFSSVDESAKGSVHYLWPGEGGGTRGGAKISRPIVVGGGIFFKHTFWGGGGGGGDFF